MCAFDTSIQEEDIRADFSDETHGVVCRRALGDYLDGPCRLQEPSDAGTNQCQIVDEHDTNHVRSPVPATSGQNERRSWMDVALEVRRHGKTFLSGPAEGNRAMEITDLPMQADSMGAALGEIESKLIELTREGSGGGRSLDEVLGELHALSRRVRPVYLALQETLEQRDLTYELVARLGEMRKRAVWLYRRSRLEQLFYAKLKLERSLRDTLYRQILEAYDEFSSMEQLEGHLRGISDDMLAAELLQEEARDGQRGQD